MDGSSIYVYFSFEMIFLDCLAACGLASSRILDFLLYYLISGIFWDLRMSRMVFLVVRG